MKRICLGMLAFLFLALPANAALTITNGSLEGYSGDGFTTLGPGNTSINGWVVGGNSIDWISSYWTPKDGINSIDLSGNGPGNISQAFATSIGASYIVTFWMAGNMDGGSPVKSLDVSAAGESQNFTFSTAGYSRTDMGWETRTFLFTADSASTTLQFTSLENSAYGAAIDNVSVNAVPIPAAVWLLGSGVAGLMVLQRRKRA